MIDLQFKYTRMYLYQRVFCYSSSIIFVLYQTEITCVGPRTSSLVIVGHQVVLDEWSEVGQRVVHVGSGVRCLILWKKNDVNSGAARALQTSVI